MRGFVATGAVGRGPISAPTGPPGTSGPPGAEG